MNLCNVTNEDELWDMKNQYYLKSSLIDFLELNYLLSQYEYPTQFIGFIKNQPEPYWEPIAKWIDRFFSDENKKLLHLHKKQGICLPVKVLEVLGQTMRNWKKFSRKILIIEFELMN
jgi:hypothetical protein